MESEWIGKGIATFGIWMAVAVVGINAPAFAMIMAIFAMLATVTIW